jgi:phage gpG-like protein
MNLANLAARVDQAISLAFAAEVGALTEALRDIFNTEPGGPHTHPWLQTGTLRNSIQADITDNEAIIFSDDPVAVLQEHGTPKLPPRPSFGPLAAIAGPGITRRIGEAAIAALRGEN